MFQVSLFDELFRLPEHKDATKASDLCTEAQNAAQKMLNQYVRIQGLQISQVSWCCSCQHLKGLGSMIWSESHLRGGGPAMNREMV